MSDHYQSRYAGLNTNQRFLIANQLAADYHLDVSQVLFTYLKVAEPILAKQTHTKQIAEATQRQIEKQFEQTLIKLSHTKE